MQPTLKLTPAVCAEARRLKAEGMGARAIARQLGIGKTSIAALLATPEGGPVYAPPSLPGNAPLAAADGDELVAATHRRPRSKAPPRERDEAEDAPGRRLPPEPPPALPEGQAPTADDEDLRVSYLAELIDEDHYHGRRTLRELALHWRAPLREVQRYAERGLALVRRDLGIGKRRQVVTQEVIAFRRLARKAEAAGKFGDATRARLAVLYAVSLGALPSAARGRPLDAAGLPPELARLKNPPASREEVVHFADTPEDLCTLAGCRTHARLEPSPAAAPRADGSSSTTPMH